MPSKTEQLVSMFERYFYLGSTFVSFFIVPAAFLIWVNLSLFIGGVGFSDFFSKSALGFALVAIPAAISMGVLSDGLKLYNKLWSRQKKLKKEVLEKLIVKAFGLGSERKPPSRCVKAEGGLGNCYVEARNKVWSNLIHEGFCQVFYPDLYRKISRSRLQLDIYGIMRFSLVLLSILSCGLFVMLLVFFLVSSKGGGEFGLLGYWYKVIEHGMIWNVMLVVVAVVVVRVLRGMIDLKVKEANQVMHICIQDMLHREIGFDRADRFVRFMSDHTCEKDGYLSLWEGVDPLSVAFSKECFRPEIMSYARKQDFQCPLQGVCPMGSSFRK